MKFNYLSFFAALALPAALFFTSCDPAKSIDIDVNTGLPQTRGFVLNEGSMGNNNSSIEVFDFSNDTICNTNIFLAQNESNLGDTGTDLIADNGSMFLTVNGSAYIAKLDGNGKIEHAISFAQSPQNALPQNGIVSGNYFYVTSTGKYVTRFQTSDLSYVDTLNIPSSAQGIAVSDGKIYTANSNMGTGNTMSIIDESSFTLDETVTVCNDPVKIYSTSNGDIFILGYDANWNTLLYSYDKQSKSVTEIGSASNVAVSGNTLYIANSATDWTTYETTTTFYTYDAASNTKNNASFLTNTPAELSTATVYLLDINPHTGDFYVGTTDYATNGTIYHFDAQGTYKSTFSSGGINPSKIVFLK